MENTKLSKNIIELIEARKSGQEITYNLSVYKKNFHSLELSCSFFPNIQIFFTKVKVSGQFIILFNDYKVVCSIEKCNFKLAYSHFLKSENFIFYDLYL